MNELLILLTITVPLLLAMLNLFKSLPWTLPLATLPALLAAFTVPVGSTVSIPWLLLGVHWQLDDIGQMFLLFSGLVWLLASLFVVSSKHAMLRRLRYQVLFLVAMAGNLLLIIAADMISFYIGFAMMGLAAYGLLLQGSQRSRQAARVYLGFTLVGELALFSGLLLVASTTGSLLMSDINAQALPDIAVTLLLLGFGIKLALPGLHPWLPLAYTTAPLISVAILSGPMMKAGLLGWMRFLPPGQAELAEWGAVWFTLGLAGLVLGTLLAMLQHAPRAVLAYSSIAKMGAMSMLFGHALSHPENANAVVAALVLFAMHHLVIKAGLFLGLEQHRQTSARTAVYVGITVMAMSLAGFPWSGGAGVKEALTLATDDSLTGILLFSGMAGALMMGMFLYRLWTSTTQAGNVVELTLPRRVAFIGWWLLVPLAWWAPLAPTSISFELKGLLVVLVAGGLLMLAHRYISLAHVPGWCRPGDVYHLFRPVRLRSPVRINQHRADSETPAMAPDFRWAGLNRTGTSLLGPGLGWLIVMALLLGLLYMPHL